MSETTVVETPVETKQSALKRFATAFYAKAKAVKARIVALFGDNETPVREDEGAARKTARLILAVPKWIGHGATTLARAVIWATSFVAGSVVIGITFAIAALFMTLMIVMLTAYKVVQLFSLILRTPYLIARGDDCLATDWSGYVQSWKPKYFYYTRISQVFAAQAAEEAAAEQPVLTVVHDRTKHEPTPKQAKHRPAKMPVLAGAEA